MSDAVAAPSGQITPNFTVAPGYILLSIVTSEDPLHFQEKPDESMARTGLVLAIGDEYQNEFGTLRKAPPIKAGDKILFRWNYNPDEYQTPDFKKYIVARFDEYRGTINE